MLLCILQGSSGAYIAVDLGFQGCQSWPDTIQVSSPVFRNTNLFPVGFTADAAGSGLQPQQNSSEWSNLLIVNGFRPSVPAVCQNDPYACGSLNQTFQILANGTEPAPPAVELSSAQQGLLAYEVSMGITQDALFATDMDTWFKSNSRNGCLSLSAELQLGSADSTQSLPSWLVLEWSLEAPDYSPIQLTYQQAPQLIAQHWLRVKAQPGVAAVGNHTIVITATDASYDTINSLPTAKSTSIAVQLEVKGIPPTVTGSYPLLEVADGNQLLYSLPANVIQLNKPYGQLAYTITQADGSALPAWLIFDGSNTIQGSPQEHKDTSYNLTVTATDLDGDNASTTLIVNVKARCPDGLYRHFRLLTFSDTLICTLSWESSNKSYPDAIDAVAGAPYNLTGVVSQPYRRAPEGYSYFPSNPAWSAFHQLPPPPDFNQPGGTACESSSWTVKRFHSFC